jgi:hypothetical protein
MKICSVCQEVVENLVSGCPNHPGKPFIDVSGPTKLSDDDLDRIAERVTKRLKGDEDLDRVATKVVGSFKKENWKAIAEEVVKRFHFPHEVEIIAKTLMGMWRFWLIFVLVIAVSFLLVYEIVGHKVQEQAKELFDKEVKKQIEAQFQQPAISNVVASVAALEATHLVSNAIEPEIIKFKEGVDPRKQRIVSASAIVQLVVGGNTTNWYNPDPQTNYQHIMLSCGQSSRTNVNGWRILTLTCKGFQHFKGSDSSFYLIEFGMDPLIRFGNVTEKDTVESIDQWNMIELAAMFLPTGSEITKGTITLTINSSTSKEFSIPSHKTAFGEVSLKNPEPGKVYVFVVSGP